MTGRGILTVVVVTAMSFFGITYTASAAPAEGGWTFSGTLTAPARSAAQVEVTVTGTIEVSQGLLDQAAFTQSCSSPDVAQVTPALIEINSRVIAPLTVGGLALLPIDDTVPTAVSAIATVSPGSYELVLQFRCSNESSWTGGVSASTVQQIVIASIVSSRYRTLACLSTLPPTQCTVNQPQYTSVPRGTSVTFGAVIVHTWSDGQTTMQTPIESQALKRTSVTSESYYTTLSSNCNHTLEVTADYKYRCEVGNQAFDPVVISVATPTSSYSLATPTVTPTFAVKGAMVTVRGTVQQTYSDGSQWPAPITTDFSVEFLPTGGSSWTTVVSSRDLTAMGSYIGTFRMTESGSVRTKVGSSTSPPVTVRLLESSDTYRLGSLSLPEVAQPRTPLPMSLTVESLWSDNTYRPAPDGTEATVEFAQAYEATPTEDLEWRIQGAERVSNGKVVFSPTPQSSGYWRISVGSTQTTPVFVQIVGSSEVTLASEIRVVEGEIPFVNGTNRYAITASLEGYVGTETIILFADMGGGMQRVAPFSSANTLSGVYSLTNGPTRGDIQVEFQARDPRGAILASYVGNAVNIDEVKTYRVTAIPARGEIREGNSARVQVLLSGTSYNGILVSVPWSGTVHVQKRSGRGWSTVSTHENVRGTRLRLTADDITKGKYRVRWEDEGVSSRPFKFNVLTMTGVLSLTKMRASTKRIEVGERSRLTAVVKAQYSNGRYYPAATGTKVELQFSSGSGWKSQRTLEVRNGRISTSVRPGGTRSYRFLLSTGVVSPSVTVTVTVPRPTRLRVNWPSTYYINQGASFTLVITTSSGSTWTGTTPLRLEYRFSTYESWKLLDTATYRGRRLSWGWGSGTYGDIYFRVVAPSLGISDSEFYTSR